MDEDRGVGLKSRSMEWGGARGLVSDVLSILPSVHLMLNRLESQRRTEDRTKAATRIVRRTAFLLVF